MNRTNHKIALQSKQWITDALLKLMSIHNYTEITITQICQEAGLCRRTFYRLFESKDDIVREYVNSLYNNLLNSIRNKPSSHYPDIALLYFEFWSVHKEFLLLIRKNNIPFNLNQTSQEKAPEIYNLVKSSNTYLDATTIPYGLAYSLGGLNNMLLEWVNQGAELTPKELTAILQMTLKTALL